MSVVIDIIVTLITCFMIVGITFWSYSWLTVRRSTINMQHYLLSIHKSEMLDEERNIQRLAKAYADMGCNAETLHSMDATTYAASELNRLESAYRITSELQKLENELEPCPICGKKPRMYTNFDYIVDFGERVVYRVGCLGRCGPVLTGVNLMSLIKSWNRYAEGMPIYPAIKPKSTNCPNCGAPVDIHAEKCAYCDTPYI